MNLIILTTAITRGEFHRRSIGKFYEQYGPMLRNMDVHHIINLDCPNKLADTFTKLETTTLFKEIIPDHIHTHIIDNDTPGFLTAYKNVVRQANELNIINEQSLIWWFEDDWKIINANKDLFNIISTFPVSQPYAFNSVQGSPLGSFRGGPIMNARYFQTYFDIVSNNVANDTCDPERQVSRWVSGIDRQNGTQRIHRHIEHNIVNIIFFYHNTSKINVKEFPYTYYDRTDKFSSDLKFNYYAIKSQDITRFQFGVMDVHANTIKFEDISKEAMHAQLSNEGINYVCIKPWMFSDIGREFNTEHSLKKWTTIHDATSYV
jgi:hypothetical protein